MTPRADNAASHNLSPPPFATPRRDADAPQRVSKAVFGAPIDNYAIAGIIGFRVTAVTAVQRSPLIAIGIVASDCQTESRSNKEKAIRMRSKRLTKKMNCKRL